jgi:hypothetical protein
VVNTLYCLEEWRGKQRISPPGDNFTPRGQTHPWGTTSPLGVKFTPGGEVKSGPQAQAHSPLKVKTGVDRWFDPPRANPTGQNSPLGTSQTTDLPNGSPEASV